MEPGQQITANLRLQRLLGQGGMGSVWVADHAGLGTQVAVKVMSRAVAGDPELVARFRREAAAAAQLKSPHVAQVFDHGISSDETPYIVMELLEGEDLGKRVEREGALPLEVVSEVVTQVAKALQRAHQLGIVHRDIKADNIFLTDHDGELLVKVLDFGIAKINTGSDVSMTSTQGTFGTPLYMSPEQLMSAKHVDARADLWSLGVAAYYMLTKRFPYSGETVGAISVAVHKGDHKAASSLRPGLSAEVDAWFQRAFRNDPAERFASAKEAAEALRAALASSRSSTISPAVSSPGSVPDPEGIGHLPTMDSRASAGKGGGAGAAAGPVTLGGASIPGVSEPRRRTALLAVVGVTVAAIATVVVLRASSSSGGAGAAKDSGAPVGSVAAIGAGSAAGSEAGSGAGNGVLVVPSTTEVVGAAAVTGVTAATATAGVATAGVATAVATTSVGVATTGAGVATTGAGAAGASGKVGPGASSKVVPKPKKDDIGF